MNPVDVGTRIRSWPGMDETFHDAMRVESAAAEYSQFQHQVAEILHSVRGTPCLHGQPLLVKRRYGRAVARFAKAYHSAIETIVRAWSTNEAVREALSTPDVLRHDIDEGSHPANGHIHLCRLDLHLDPGGGFQVLETNANCPAALMSSGIASALWREFLSDSSFALPSPLDHETPDWTAGWYIENATVETGTPPDFVALFREQGGNRLELPGLASELARAGIDSLEVDPRDVTLTRTGSAVVSGRKVRHGYLKLGMQAYTSLRPQIDALVTAVRTRSVFVQNGLNGRLVGDNKLCLAILSDPAFEYLFPRATIDGIRNHIPWSRGVAHCSSADLADIRENRAAYVLKHPYDTRGRSVIVGRGIPSDSSWADALSFAVRGRWLVQRFCETTDLDLDTFDGETYHHDLSVGLINGQLAGAFVRSGKDLRLNLAQSGRLHPVFIEL